MSIRRSFGTYEVAMLPPFMKPESVQAAEAAANSFLTTAYDQGLFSRKLDANGTPVLRIISAPEFAYNGYRDQTDGKYKYDASNPISVEMYQKLMDTIAKYADQIDPSVVICPGTAVVDTGLRTDDGKIVIENRSMLMQGTFGLSSADAAFNIVNFSKELLSNIDLPPNRAQEFQFNPGTGPTLVSIKDFSGGQDGVIALTVCLDATLLGKVPFPIEPQIVLNPSAGSPNLKPVSNADLVVIDAARLPWADPQDAILTSRSYAPKTGLAANYPTLSKFLDVVGTVTGGGVISDAFQALVGTMVLGPNETFNSLRRFEPMQNKIVTTSSGTEIVLTPERALPVIDSTALSDLKQKLSNPNANISILFPQGTTLDNSPGRPDAPLPGEGPKGFDPNDEQMHSALLERVAQIRSARPALAERTSA